MAKNPVDWIDLVIENDKKNGHVEDVNPAWKLQCNSMKSLIIFAAIWISLEFWFFTAYKLSYKINNQVIQAIFNNENVDFIIPTLLGINFGLLILAIWSTFKK